MISFPRIRALFLTCAGLLFLALGQPAPAQPALPVDSFDLVLVGTNLTPDAHRISLKTNPGQGETWTPVVQSNRSPRCLTTEGLLVVPDLPVDRYVGQDIRENHLSLQITTEAPSTNGALRAVYALPSVDALNNEACAQLARLIEANPSTVRRHSLAAYVRPRPVSLEADAPFIDHIEVPVRHHKPGVLEVEWLELLFRNDG